MKFFIFCILTLWATDATAEYDPFVELMKELGYKWDCSKDGCSQNLGGYLYTAAGGDVPRSGNPKHYVCQNCRVYDINKVELAGNNACTVKKGTKTTNTEETGSALHPKHRINKIPVKNTKMNTTCDCHITTDTAKLAESLNLPEPPLKQGNCQIRTLHGSTHTNKQQLVECLKEGGIPLDENDDLKEEETGKFNFHLNMTLGTVFVHEMYKEAVPKYVELVIDKTDYNHVEYSPKGSNFETIMKCLVKLKLVNTLFHLAVEKGYSCPAMNGLIPGVSKIRFACNPK